MSDTKHLLWDNFRATVLVRGQQRVHRVSEQPRVEIFSDGNASRLGIWIEVPADTTIPPDLSALETIHVRVRALDHRTVLEVETSMASLERQFYYFAVAVAERVIREGMPATSAVSAELQCFSELLVAKAFLPIQRQIGLLGELLFLEHLSAHYGQKAFDAWLGPAGEPHDFRHAAREFEVKSTLSARRIHTIHGASQMLPSDGCSLYLVSVLLGPAGAEGGMTLPDKVDALRSLLAEDHGRRKRFEDALEAVGYRSSDSIQYTRRFALRQPLALVPVDTLFPAILPQTIRAMLGGLSARIDSIQYDINIEGLEHLPGTPVFDAALAGWPDNSR